MKQEDTVYQYIEKAIPENRMPPGARLRELQLAELTGNRVLAEFVRDILNRTPLVIMWRSDPIRIRLALASITIIKTCCRRWKPVTVRALDIMTTHLQQLEDMFTPSVPQPGADLNSIFQHP